jgi:hypothetical protein
MPIERTIAFDALATAWLLFPFGEFLTAGRGWPRKGTKCTKEIQGDLVIQFSGSRASFFVLRLLRFFAAIPTKPCSILWSPIMGQTQDRRALWHLCPSFTPHLLPSCRCMMHGDCAG